MTPSAVRTIVLPLACVLLAVAGCGTGSSKGAATPVATQHVPPTPVVSGGSVAAVVNGHRVPMSTYRTLLTLSQRQSVSQPGSPPPNLRVLASQTMQSVVIDEIIRQYAAAHHITVTKGEIAQQELNDTAQLGGRAGFEQRLKQLGLTRQQYKELVLPSILGQKVERKVAPPSTKPQPVADVRHILLMPHPSGPHKRTLAQAHTLAQTLLKRLQQGASFAALARQYSDDPGSSAKGGEYPKVSPHEMVPEFDHAAFTLPYHHPEIIHTTYGYHIIEVLHRGMAAPSAQSQQQAERSQFLAWINAQLKKAKVQRIARVKGT